MSITYSFIPNARIIHSKIIIIRTLYNLVGDEGGGAFIVR